MKENVLFGLMPFLAIGRPDFSAVLLGFIVDAATKNEGCPRRLMPDDSQLKPTIEKKIGTPRSFEGMDSQVQEIYPGDDSSFPISYDVGRTDDVIQQPAVSIVRHPELYSEDLGPEEKNLGLNPEAAEFHPEDGTLFPSSRSGPSVPGPFENPLSRSGMVHYSRRPGLCRPYLGSLGRSRTLGRSRSMARSQIGAAF